MSITTLVGFLTVKDKKGKVQDRYQNAKRDNFNSLTDDDGEYIKNKWTVQVDVCKVDPTSLAWERTLTTEIWLAASMSYDPSTIDVLLSSGIDAVGSNAPNRVLTSHLCGHLPTSGQIRNA